MMTGREGIRGALTANLSDASTRLGLQRPRPDLPALACVVEVQAAVRSQHEGRLPLRSVELALAHEISSPSLAPLRTGLGCLAYIHGFIFDVVVQCFRSALSPDTTAFHAAEWCAGVKDVVVHPDRAGSDTSCDLDTA